MATSLIGHKIGRYQVIAELGRGQHSVVYKARQPSLERHVALKVLHRYDQNTLRKFQAEAILTAKLIEQGAINIRQVYEVGQTADGYLFVAMEYVDNSLLHLLQRARERRKLFNPEAAARLLLPVAQALDSIHKLGWTHLDVKPQNILLSKSGRTFLADLGIAQPQGARTSACTPIYASPEQADGNRPVGPWSDIYSLGVVLYEMVTGHLPFQGDLDIVILNKHLTENPPPPRAANSRLSAAQERAILKALAKSPQERPKSATEFLNAIIQPPNRFSGVIEVPSGVLHTTSSWFRRLPQSGLIIGLLLAILAILLFLGWALRFYMLPAVEATQTAAATVLTPLATATAPPTATMTRPPPPSLTPTPSPRPTSTLAPTPTRTPRPKPTRTRKPTPEPSGSPTPRP